MTLDEVWMAWQRLSRPDRSKFLARLRGVYAEERAAVLRKNERAAHGARVESLMDLTVTPADLGLERRW
ncbi:hypothetical protein [Bradyrhizobium sp. BR 1432]|uniref:hypothetical protein n=1 Tax=Bradyrhizobium sp. BR 1432 TaxID=3447966 RepID=UPI003EE75B3A